VWRFGATTVTKVFPTEKAVEEIVLDPYLEIADTDTSNNYYPPREKLNRFEMFKQRQFGSGGENPMQRAERAKKMKKEIKP
ncbi:MAG: hypothetical protein HKN09_00080, partial [Saprospiraceae bacterium]|nr:hypothetical protein [Saprospiraceae bacterium]